MTPEKARNRIIILFLAFLFLPFLLLTNFYPFMRFSMFAEPVRAKNTPITYLLKTDSKTNNTLVPKDLFHKKVMEHKANNSLLKLARQLSQLDPDGFDVELLEVNELSKDTTLLVRYEK